MSIESLTPIRPVVVPTLPVSAVKGDTVVLTTDGHLYTYDGSTWVDNGSGGSGGSGISQVQSFIYGLGS